MGGSKNYLRRKTAPNGWHRMNNLLALCFTSESINRSAIRNADPLAVMMKRGYSGTADTAQSAETVTTAKEAYQPNVAATSLKQVQDSASWTHRRVPTTLEGTRAGGVTRKK